MIGSSRECKDDKSVLEKLSTLKVDDIYEIPNVFQVITKTEEPSDTAWKSLMSHPFTPSYIRLNLAPYIQAVQRIVTRYRDDAEFVRESLQFLHRRVSYEKNRKKVYVAVVENILPYLIEHHDNTESRAILDDIVLSKESMSLLEAYLMTKMYNYTSTFVHQAKLLDLAQTTTIYEILCSGVKSKKSNKMLLRWYTEVCGTDVSKNVALLGIMHKHRIYQIEEDKEQGYEISTHFTTLLTSVTNDDFCKIAISILPLNHSVVCLKTALSNCNDQLLAELALTYHKIGKLLQLFREIIVLFNPRISLGEEFRSRLSEISGKFSEQQLLKLLELFYTTLEENTNTSTAHLSVGSDDLAESRDTPKRQKVSDERLCSFVADCTSILLNQCHVDVPSQYLLKLHDVTKRLPRSTGKSLVLFFNSAVGFDKIPSLHSFEVEETSPSNEEEILLQVKSLHYCDNATDKLDRILSTIPSYSHAILSNFLLIYDHMITDHMVTVADFLISGIRSHRSFIESEVFSRCTDLHSVIISRVMQSMGGIDGKYYSDPLVDLTLSAAREIFKKELSTSRPEPDHDDLVDWLYLLSQLPLNSCYLRLLVTTWILSREVFTCSDCRPPEENGGDIMSVLGRFCKPPPPYTPLPAVHGKYAGEILAEMLTKDVFGTFLYFDERGVVKFVELYLSVGVSMSSCDLTDLINHLGTCEVDRTSAYIMGVLARDFSLHNAAVSRYQEELIDLRDKTSKILLDDAVVALPFSKGYELITCEVLCAVLDLEALVVEKSKYDLTEHLSVRYNLVQWSLLSSSKLEPEYKLKLVQKLLDHVSKNKDNVTIFTNTLLECCESLHLMDEKKIDLKTSCKGFIDILLARLPNKNAEFLIHHTKFDPSLVETVSAPIVPISLIPKFINKLTKVQVMNSLKIGSEDPHLLSRCLLCLVQHNYPIHLLNSIYNPILKLLATEHYLHSPQTISNIVRASELLSKQKEVARHHVPYILCNIFEFVSKSNPALVKDITPAVYPLFDVCLVQGLQYLQARLSQPARQLFLQIQSHYKQNIKYQGKT